MFKERKFKVHILNGEISFPYTVAEIIMDIFFATALIYILYL